MSDEFRLQRTEVLLRRVAAARAQGDWTLARREWEACVVRASQRVATVVDRYVARGWIPRADRDDVVQDALVRGGRRLVDTLDTLGEDAFFASMVRVADFQCRDSARRFMRIQQRERPLELAHEPEADWRREEEVVEATAQIDALLPRLRDRRAHKIFVMHRLGAADPQIAEQLGISVANVHTIRSRALTELRGLIDQ